MMDFVTVEKGKIMAEYIDKEAAIEAAKHAWAKGLEPSQYIETIPSAEVADVVRCWNCIGRSTWYNDTEYGCAVCGMSGMYPKSEDGFCSYGIRKDGDEGWLNT